MVLQHPFGMGILVVMEDCHRISIIMMVAASNDY